MKNFIFVILLLCSLSITLNAEWVKIQEKLSEDIINCVSDNNGKTVLKFQLDGYESEIIEKEFKQFTRISYPNEGISIEKGLPSLPKFSRMIAIPEDSKLKVKILSKESELLKNITIYPAQNLQSESKKDEIKSFCYDQEFYNSSLIFPSEIVQIGETAKLRDFNVATISINPFQYNPNTNELNIHKNLTIEIETDDKRIVKNNQKISKAFLPLYESVLINFDQISSRELEFNQPSYLFIYRDNPSVESRLEELVEWKKRKGFEVNVASSITTGTNLSQIKSYIQNAYDNWENPPEYICLLGDVTGAYGLPTAYENGGEGDHFYTLLDGNDILADAFIGRLSFETTTELRTIINKILTYEMEPYIDETNWYNRALMVGDPSSSGPSTIDTKRYVKNMIDVHAPNIISTEVYSGSWVSQISSNINQGVSYFNYRGFYDMSGWQNNNISALDNGRKLCVAVFLTCGVGNFASETSRNEKFLRVGTPSSPKGAVAAIGTATSSTHTTFNNCVDAGIFHGVFADKIYNMGGALVRGKLNLYNNFPGNPGNKVNEFSYWNNLMGDPGMEVWTESPKNLIVSHPTEIQTGTNFIEFSLINDDREPVNDAWVTIINDDETLFETAYTDEHGFVRFQLDNNLSGSIKITATKHNYKPYLDEIDIIDSETNLQIINTTILNESISSDGEINPGEQIDIMIELKNYGSNSCQNISANLLTDDENITISGNEIIFGTIPSNSSIMPEDTFTIQIPSNFIGGEEIILYLEITDSDSGSWTDIIRLYVNGPPLIIMNQNIIDNNNSLLDPGELASLTFLIYNNGQQVSNDVYGELICDDPRIDITDNSGFFGSISTESSEENSDNTFELEANVNLLAGMQIPFNLRLYNDDGYDSMISFLLPIGEVDADKPTGPDNYGYFCYEDLDSGYADTPTYNWIEISGVGTNCGLNDNGDEGNVITIDIPFYFKMYGESYDKITISSNGWVAPGETANESFMNWNIPGPLGPSPLVAVFWDDLITGDVYYHYDENRGAMIVEWKDMINQYNHSSIETFQVLLYDPAVKPTSTGDSQILMQYKEIDNVDQGMYDWTVAHGLYATIGIEGPTGLDGLEYTCNNTYPVSAREIDDESALLFTCAPVFSVEPLIIYNGINILDNDGSETADFGETLNLEILLKNVGNTSAHNLTGTISCDDEYISFENENVTFTSIESGNTGINTSDILLTVSENCPDAHNVFFDLLVTNGTLEWNIDLNIKLNSPQINYKTFSINDNGNMILDPGESADFLLTLQNEGGCALENSIVDISCTSDDVVISSNTYEIGYFPANKMKTAIFSLETSSELTAGDIIELSIEINGHNNFTENLILQIQISAPVEIIDENFNSVLPPGWGQDTQTSIPWEVEWMQQYSNMAGGTSPEAVLYCFDIWNGYSIIHTPEINSIGLLELEIEFKYFFWAWHDEGFTLSVVTRSGNGPWNNASTLDIQVESEITENIIISTEDIGEPDLQVGLKYSSEHTQADELHIDDFIIRASNSATYGFLTGNIVLSGGNGNINKTIISANNYSASVDSTGAYNLPLPAGTYDVIIENEGYESQICSITINSGLETTQNFTLNYLAAPTDLELDMVESNVSLNWLAPQTEAFREFQHYIIYRNRNGSDYDQIATSTEESYSDNISQPGNYKYFVTAQYDNGESSPSNIMSTLLLENNDIPSISKTELKKNFPNPFNPVTDISFSLKKSQHVSLEIFNILGQKVKTLVNKELDAGEHLIRWEGKNDKNKSVASGIYFYKMKTNNYENVRKMLLLK